MQGHAPAKLHNSPIIITTAVNLENIGEENMTHWSCRTTIMAIEVS